MARFFVAVRELVRGWWCVDRIRVSPRQGRLLRLDRGSWLSIRGNMVEVVERVVRDTPSGPLVCYETRCEKAFGKLWIAAESPESIMWVSGDSEETMLASEIEVWA